MLNIIIEAVRDHPEIKEEILKLKDVLNNADPNYYCVNLVFDNPNFKKSRMNDTEEGMLTRKKERSG